MYPEAKHFFLFSTGNVPTDRKIGDLGIKHKVEDSAKCEIVHLQAGFVVCIFFFLFFFNFLKPSTCLTIWIFSGLIFVQTVCAEVISAGDVSG